MFEEKVSTVSKIHVREPVPAYCELLAETIKISKAVIGFNKGVYNGEPMFLDFCKDLSLLLGTDRQVPKHLHKEKTLTVETVSIK